MNDLAPETKTDFFFRRLTDPIKVFGTELPGELWLVILGVVLLAAFFYVGWMYLKDSRGVGPVWATILGLLRTSVYVILAVIFLLPANRQMEYSRPHSKVLVLIDASDSMTNTRDDLPEPGKKFDSVPARQDKVLTFLKEKDFGFFNRLREKNPVTLNRFGTRPDEEYLQLNSEGDWTREEWEARQRESDNKKDPTKKPAVETANVGEKLSPEYWGGWTFPNRRLPAEKEVFQLSDKSYTALVVDALPDVVLERLTHLKEQKLEREAFVTAVNKVLKSDDLKKSIKPEDQERFQALVLKHSQVKSRLAKLADANVRHDDAGVFKGTNVTQATLDLLTRKLGKMVQGIIVITDGRNTTPVSTETMLKLETLSRSERVPIFVVGVGSNRPQVRIDVIDLRSSKIIRPEDAFKATVEVQGIGLPDEPAKVVLDVTRINTARDGTESLQPITLVEAETKENKDGMKEEISLGPKLTLQPIEPVKFDRNTPPRAMAEFQFDAVSLARAAGVDLTADKYHGKDGRPRKWEIAESKRAGAKEGDELVLQARIAVDQREIFEGTAAKDVASETPVAAKDREKMLPIHVSEKTGVQVLRKPVQVLLFASGALREYQFVRTLLFREMEKERVMLSIFMQSYAGGTAEDRKRIMQDVPAKRFLEAFPSNFDQPAENEDAKLNDLSSYDVLIAFDPDWTQLDEKVLKNVQKWVERGGGMIAIGGPINTLQLARPGANKDKLKPILDLYPVVLKDIRIDEGDRKLDRPWPLDFSKASPDMEYLKLSEEVERGSKPFLSDWEEFWGRPEDNPDKTAAQRGIFNFYPLDLAKQGAHVVASFTDPQAKLKDGDPMPYIVATDPASTRRVVWIGSGEIWRLRQYKEVFYERFWTKLVRYVGSANAGKSSKRITVYLGRRFTANQFVEFEARADGLGGVPLGPRARPPEIILKVPAANPSWKVTEKSLEALRNDGVPKDQVVKLNGLLEKPYDQEEPFVRELTNLLPPGSLTSKPKDKDDRTLKELIMAHSIDTKELPKDLTMKPKTGPGSEGWFTGRFQVRLPGTYELEVRVPETNDSTPPQKFIVMPSNPELDDVRPDFDLMYRMASEAEMVRPRMEDAAWQELRRHLIRPALGDPMPGDKPEPKGGKDKETARTDKSRLYFDLSNAHLIPSCMKTVNDLKENKGLVTDLWDQSIPAIFGLKLPPIFNVLALVVFLLSLEWLIRKLLRLA